MNSVWVVSHVLLWVIIAVQGVLILALMRQVGALMLRIGPGHALDAGTGPSVGEEAPWMPRALTGLDSASQRMLMLVFVSTTCGACDELVPAINAVGRGYGNRVGLAVVGRERGDEMKKWATRHKLRVPVRSSPTAFQRYDVTGTPYAYVINGQGRVGARGGVNHIEHLEALIQTCAPSTHAEEVVEVVGNGAREA